MVKKGLVEHLSTQCFSLDDAPAKRVFGNATFGAL